MAQQLVPIGQVDNSSGIVYAPAGGAAAPSMPMMGASTGNWLQALLGGMNTVAGTIRTFRLDDAMLVAKESREAADKAQAAAVALTDGAVDLVKLREALIAINAVNERQQVAALDRARVDRIQNQSEIYRAVGGIAELGQGLGYGQGGIPGFGGGSGMGGLLPAAAVGLGAGLLGAAAFRNNNSTSTSSGNV